jgi:hypothetical protein
MAFMGEEYRGKAREAAGNRQQEEGETARGHAAAFCLLPVAFFNPFA